MFDSTSQKKKDMCENLSLKRSIRQRKLTHEATNQINKLYTYKSIG